MKNVNGISLAPSGSCVDTYNAMRRDTPTSLYEACRTLEALNRVRTNVTLVEAIRKEATKNGKRI